MAMLLDAVAYMHLMQHSIQKRPIVHAASCSGGGAAAMRNGSDRTTERNAERLIDRFDAITLQTAAWETEWNG